MSDFQITGADDFLRLSKALKAAGQTGLRKELNKAMKNAARPLVPKAKAAFRTEFPQRGGLAAFYAKKTITPAVLTGRAPGVKLRVSKADPRLDSEGRLVHPVFFRVPRKRRVVVQRIKPRVFSSAMEREAPAIRGELETALSDVADRVVREVR